MTKIKSLVLSIVSAYLAFNSFAYQQILLGLAFAALCALCLIVCTYKYRRDNRFVKGRLEQVSAPSMQPPLQGVSKSSRRLFVPPPLNHHK